MDVQALAPTLSSTTFTLPPLPGTGDGSPATPVGAVTTAPVTPPGGLGNGSSSSTTTTTTSAAADAGPDPGAALLPPSPSGEGKGESLASNIGKVFNAPADSSYQVSFQPAEGTNEIVTVVTDKHTGKVVTQFPSETLIALAQFFQKIDNAVTHNGAVVDKKA
jgi:uncharacterized FlaG/YvyC family protein